MLQSLVAGLLICIFIYFLVGMAPILSKCIPINTIGSCKVSEDDKLMEYDALLLDWFFDSYYPGFTVDDPKETATQ